MRGLRQLLITLPYPTRYKSEKREVPSKMPINSSQNMTPLENSDIPKQLEYLKPVISKMSSPEADELFGPDMLFDKLLDDAIKQRIKGKTLKEAKELIKSDYELMKRWLEHSDKATPHAHYIHGQLMGSLIFDGIGHLQEH